MKTVIAMIVLGMIFICVGTGCAYGPQFYGEELLTDCVVKTYDQDFNKQRVHVECDVPGNE